MDKEFNNNNDQSFKIRKTEGNQNEFMKRVQNVFLP